jgi:hypothetical protein
MCPVEPTFCGNAPILLEVASRVGTNSRVVTAGSDSAWRALKEFEVFSHSAYVILYHPIISDSGVTSPIILTEVAKPLSHQNLGISLYRAEIVLRIV